MTPRFLVTTALLTTLGFAPPAFADEKSGCHFHGSKPAAQSVVGDCARQVKADLVAKGKLPASWLTVPQAAIETVDGKKGKEWKVVFTDPAAQDKSKATLYLFFTLPGNFIAANFDGR